MFLYSKPHFATGVTRCEDVHRFHRMFASLHYGWVRKCQEAETTPPICSPKSAEAACQGQATVATEQNHSVLNGFCISVNCIKLYQSSWC